MNDRKLKWQLCWSKDQTSIFLELLRSYPVLYDQNHPSYGSQALKAKVYTHISEELKAFKPDVTPDLVRKKFEILKKQYFIERRLKERSQGKTYKPKLWCYDLMNFFEEQINTKRNSGDVDMHANIVLNENDNSLEVGDSNIEIEIDDSIFEEIDNYQEVKTSKIASRKRLSEKCLQLVSDLESTFKAVKEEREKEAEKTIEQSPQTFLGLMIESELSKVNEEIYDEAKWKIIRILEEASKLQCLARTKPVQLKPTPPPVTTLPAKRRQVSINKQMYLGNGTKVMMIKGIGVPNSTITRFDSIGTSKTRCSK